MSVLQCGRFRLDLSQPRVMAIINLTDDSFSGDGLRQLDIKGGNGRVEADYSWLTNSDVRLKKNISTLDNSLEKISHFTSQIFTSIPQIIR